MPEEPQTKRRRSLGSGALIALFGLPFALFVAFLLFQRSTPDALEARLAERPELEDTLAAFRTAYPDDYRAFLARVSAVADAEGQSAAERAAGEDIRRFVAGKADAIVRAPAADLHALARAIAALVAELQRVDAGLCAQFVTQGAMEPARLPAPASRAIGRMNAQFLTAARGGEAGGSPRGPLSPPDTAAWLQRMAAIDPALVRQAQTGGAADMRPARLCANGVTVHRAAAELPEAQAANVMAHLVRQSFGGAGAATQ
ncbi:hypothetical protein RCO27_00535 [Sphingosinicella sp. LHD-64]|uniref:hypothetical protein n=1 Tax=Sphingosinicella sp. LHD-64 TaxID=3072139 RepID=UPI00280D4072|nr:hypothetical protein [Sphingosinicella sp. LHD-64]MDQ8754704.1 hypothetical protein [Sphingosinicella sp. LHD-64]